ncbi:MAG: 50S ribosomal protein L17 [Planctomycetota bacterium]
MRHRVAGRTLGRKTNHRTAMFRNMAVALFSHGQITTTVPKAKAVRPFVERLITAAKKRDLASRRRVISALGGDKHMIKDEDAEGVERNRYGELKRAPKIVKHLFDEIAPAYADRNGGYTRIIRLGKHRIGDGSDLCVLQLVTGEETGPQLAGKRTRRAKSNKRMEFAAKLAKGESAEDEAASAVAEPEEETAEAPAEEAAAEESPAEDAEASAEDSEEAEKKDGE